MNRNINNWKRNKTYLDLSVGLFKASSSMRHDFCNFFLLQSNDFLLGKLKHASQKKSIIASGFIEKI